MVARSLPELIRLGMSNKGRRELEGTVKEAFLPAHLSEDVPLGVLADWHEEHGNCAAAEMLRAMIL